MNPVIHRTIGLATLVLATQSGALTLSLDIPQPMPGDLVFLNADAPLQSCTATSTASTARAPYFPAGFDSFAYILPYLPDGVSGTQFTFRCTAQDGASASLSFPIGIVGSTPTPTPTPIPTPMPTPTPTPVSTASSLEGTVQALASGIGYTVKLKVPTALAGKVGRLSLCAFTAPMGSDSQPVFCRTEAGWGPYVPSKLSGPGLAESADVGVLNTTGVSFTVLNGELTAAQLSAMGVNVYAALLVDGSRYVFKDPILVCEGGNCSATNRNATP